MSWLTLNTTWPHGAPPEDEPVLEGAEIILDFMGMSDVEAAEVLVEAAVRQAADAIRKQAGGDVEVADVETHARLWVITQVATSPELSHPGT